jgi:ribosomal protein S18 acetylase RimI-like enzyme
MNIERLSREEKGPAVAVLMAAFHDYPVMRYMLKTTGNEYEEQLQTILEFYCEARFAKEGLVLGIRQNGSLVAIGLVDQASHKPWDQLKSELERLKAKIGESAFSRLQWYEDLSSRSQPQVSHYYLGMIAVRPENQGQGYGRAILECVQQLSSADPKSAGVCLSTELPDNVRLYEHFGYQIIAEVDIENLHSWCLFLPTITSR